MIIAARSIAAMSIALCLLGCVTSMAGEETAPCAFPDSIRTAAPVFMCGADITGFPVTQLRSSEPNADRSVTERIQAVLDDQIMQWAVEWSTAWYENEQQRGQAKNELLLYLEKEARVVRSRTSPKNRLWLLIGVPDTLSEVQQKLADNQ